MARLSENTAKETEQIITEYRQCKTSEERHLYKAKLRRTARILRDSLKTINALEKCKNIPK